MVPRTVRVRVVVIGLPLIYRLAPDGTSGLVPCRCSCHLPAEPIGWSDSINWPYHPLFPHSQPWPSPSPSPPSPSNGLSSSPSLWHGLGAKSPGLSASLLLISSLPTLPYSQKNPLRRKRPRQIEQGQGPHQTTCPLKRQPRFPHPRSSTSSIPSPPILSSSTQQMSSTPAPS